MSSHVLMSPGNMSHSSSLFAQNIQICYEDQIQWPSTHVPHCDTVPDLRYKHKQEKRDARCRFISGPCASHACHRASRASHVPVFPHRSRVLILT